MDITSLSHNQLVEDHFAVIKVSQKQTRDGKPFLDVKLSHSTGPIDAKVWSEVIPQVTLKENSVAFISAKAQEYQGKISLII